MGIAKVLSWLTSYDKSDFTEGRYGKGQNYETGDGVTDDEESDSGDVNSMLETRRISSDIADEILFQIIVSHEGVDSDLKLIMTFSEKHLMKYTGKSEEEILNTPISISQDFTSVFKALRKAQAVFAIRRYPYLKDIISNSIESIKIFFTTIDEKKRKRAKRILQNLVIGQGDFEVISEIHLMGFSPDPIENKNYAGINTSVWLKYASYIKQKSPIMAFNIISWLRSANKEALEKYLEKEDNPTAEEIHDLVESISTEQQSPK